MAPGEALTLLASGHRESVNGASMVIMAAFLETQQTETAIVEGNYHRYTDAERTELLDGLERIARSDGSVETDDVPVSARHAMTALAMIGLQPSIADRGAAAGVPARLMRLYHGADRIESRGSALRSLARLLALDPPEADEIVELLVSVASQPYAPDRVPAQTALYALRAAGERGVPVLRRLHAQDAVVDPNAAMHLRELARRGFPVEGGDLRGPRGQP